MTTPSRPATPAPRRRSVLRAAGTLALTGALAGCGVEWGNLRLAGDRGTSPVTDPDELLRRRSVGTVAAILTTTAAVRHRVSQQEGAGEKDSADGNRSGASQLGLASTLPQLMVAQREWLSALGSPRPADATLATSSPRGPSGAPTAAAPAELVSSLQASAAALLSALGDAGGPMVRLVAAVVGGLLVGLRELAIAIGAARPAPPRARDHDVPGVDDPQLATWLHPPTAPPGLPAVSPRLQSPAVSAMLGSIADDSVRTSLAACIQREYAAEYGYPLLAVPLSGQARAGALARSAIHRTAAANLTEVAEALGFPASPAELAYPVDAASGSPAARATALKLELDCADAFSVVVARLGAQHARTRALFVDAMIARVLAARVYGAVPTLPGLAEHR